MAVVMKVGAWGASDGTPRDIISQSKPQRLESITIYSSEDATGCIYGFSFTYVDQQGEAIDSGIWGSNRGTRQDPIQMSEGEQLKLVSGTANDSGIASLTLQTNKTTSKTYGFPAVF